MWIDIEPGCELPKDYHTVPVSIEISDDILYADLVRGIWINEHIGQIIPVAWYKVPPYQPKKQEQP